MKHDFSIAPLNGLPQKKNRNPYKRRVSEKSTCRFYAEIAPAKLTSIPKSKKRILFLVDFN